VRFLDSGQMAMILGRRFASVARGLQMKIILSRKGFDSSSGGVPSPIFSDGDMLSLPIPDRASTVKYDEIAGNSWATVGELRAIA
jgi:hypothetical protein